ncbi:YeiH family protein [Methylobacillus sp.]|jgi:uncharacterized integral membrane protein (TIGR00698 family)|uniref:YeiH family protein n=1 Tax=Methylobacillus sp. TaxID=56818 RepID=UPI002FDFB07D
MGQKLNFQIVLPGVAFSLAIASVALVLSDTSLLKLHVFSPLTLAILIGIGLGNTIYPKIAKVCASGVTFSRQWLLQLGIILYGFRLTFSDIANVGLQGVLIDALVLTSTFALAWIAGHKLLRLNSHTVVLIGAGSAICGAAAVMATEPIVRGRAEHASVAVSTVLIFGTLAMFIYPALYTLNQTWHWLPASHQAFGLFTGSTIHEVAQVVATGETLGDTIADTAVITKMVRVMMLAPFLMLLSVYLANRQPTKTECANQDKPLKQDKKKTKVTIPWFAVIFILVAGLNSLAILPSDWVRQANELDTLLLTMAMAALGLCTHLSALKQAGVKPILLGGLLFAWLIVGGTVINYCIVTLLA